MAYFFCHFFQGNELVEAILDGPIVVIKDPRTEKNRVIDPGHIGKQLMTFRQQEAQIVVEVSKALLLLLLPLDFCHQNITWLVLCLRSFDDVTCLMHVWKVSGMYICPQAVNAASFYLPGT